MSSRPRRSGGMMYLLALHVASELVNTDRRPPVTASLIAANTLIYLRPGPLHKLLPTISEVCLQPNIVVKNKDLKRVFLSAFYHLDDSHLVYNMLSLLWKGVQLERMMGSPGFAAMVVTLLGLSHGILVASAKILDRFFDYPYAWSTECSVGFSCVLFAMKVILNSNSADYTSVYGVLVPARFAAWAELFLIQMFAPRASFLGHLSGILAGIVYLKIKRYLSGSNPLGRVFQKVTSVIFSPLHFITSQLFGGRRRGRFTGHGTAGARSVRRGGGNGYSGAVWRCPQCTYDNSIYVEICEMCATRRTDAATAAPPEELLQSQFGSGSGSGRDLSLEELRRLRLERFDRMY